MTALVNVDLREGEYIISTYSRVSRGPWVLDGTPTRVPYGAAADEVGAQVHTALGKSREGLEPLTRDSKPAQPLLDLLGLPNYSSYLKGTKSVEVYAEATDAGQNIEVTPQRNEGPREGFAPIEEEVRGFTYESPAQLGSEVINAFDKAL